MQVGEKYTLFWKAPHRIECEIIELKPDYVVVNADHRCGFSCQIKAMKNTLSIEGEMHYTYGDFEKLFLPLNVDAIALPPAKKTHQMNCDCWPNMVSELCPVHA